MKISKTKNKKRTTNPYLVLAGTKQVPELRSTHGLHESVGRTGCAPDFSSFSFPTSGGENAP
jgi:hypothetical protein